ncbi:golgin subfamily A member 4-like [Betta splendens]|uniref:Golgin subfamily A member 4-like n=1 Tax=Betta splendens TaxID=158456 RepID=A0A8M1HHI6_BETSP|nr:golgin subfamily A member 4-like [Betta splendens]
MSKQQSRWSETLVKTNAPSPKKGGKDPAALTVPVSGGGKQSGSTTCKPSTTCGRSLNSRSADSTFGGSLKRGSLSQPTKPASGPARPGLRLCSSRSFSSLHTSSFAAVPFMRSSRSLSRLDQRAAREDHARKDQTTGKKVLDSGQRSSSVEKIRINPDQCHGDNVKKMKTRGSFESSSSVSTSDSHRDNDKVKKESRDGVYTLCAMTSGMRRNWVQAVLKNVRPSQTHDTISSFSEEGPQQTSESDVVERRAESPNSSVQESSTRGWAEDSHPQPQGQEGQLQLEGEQSSADGSSASSAVPPISPPQQMEEDERASCHQCPPVAAATQTGPTEASSAEGSGSDSSGSKGVEDENATQSEEQRVSLNSNTCECPKEEDSLRCENQTGQLVRELEQTQRELSRLQQINRNVQDELEREREKNDLLNSSLSSDQSLAFQRLHKLNHDLRVELEAEKRSQEEAREAELRRRVDLLAQQAQLLVTGDATALAQAHLEQDRRRFHEQRAEWERSVASLEAQLAASEQQRGEAERRLAELQQELQGFHSLQQEAERLQLHLQEVTTHLCASEKAQAQKDARLQKHIMLLQASQDRERRSLTASLAQAEDHSQDLQKRLDRAEQQVESLSRSQTWAREIEEAQQQLQEELARTISAVEKLQEEREQLDRRCQELQNQLSEADGEVNRLQSRLQADETHYYNLEHSYERACEELQLALGKVHQRESETQEIREGYDQLLDRKEQELSEVLLKMEVLGNSLEETEVKLHEMQKVCTCASSQPKDKSPQLKQGRRQEPRDVNDSRLTVMECVHEDNSSNAYVYVSGSHEPARSRSRSIDLSYQSIISAGDDQESFVSVIQLLETKLFVTEEKLRDITHRLEEHQSHITCQDPHLCSQLTQSRATAQHLSLLLHSQAKRSQRFALETENRCRLLAGRFQAALNAVQSCRERRHGTDFEKQLATVAACLQQGRKEAENLQHESYNVGRGENKILTDDTLAGAVSSSSIEGAGESLGKYVRRELYVVEKMVSVLQGQQGITQLSGLSREDEGDVAHRYKSTILQRLALKTEGEDTLDGAIARVCAEAELIYIAMKLTQQNDQRKGLADISPPELAPYEEQVQEDGGGSEEEPVVNGSSEAEKEPEWLEMLISSLQRRAKLLHQLCQEVPDEDRTVAECGGCGDSTVDPNWVQEHAKLVYLSERLCLDLEQELQQSEALQSKLQDIEKEQEGTLTDELEVLSGTLSQLQGDNNALREELERAEHKIQSVESGNQRLIEDVQKIEGHREKLEGEFQQKIKTLQQIHEEEMKHLHDYYTKTFVSKEKQSTEGERGANGEPGGEAVDGDAPAVTSFQEDVEKLQVTAVEEMHRKMIEDLQQQHRTEVAALVKEKDQLLQEETAATMAAIVAMRRAHKQELEKYRQSHHFRENADITQLHIEYEKEIQLLHKELESLSVQHTQKCLENSQLSQELQGEKELLVRYQQENQDLKQKQVDAHETDCSLNGDQSLVAPQLNDFYEMEVILRAREAEMQFLLQEARSLKDELKIARMDKIYAQNKLKALYKSSQEESHHDVHRSREEMKFATWSPSREASGQQLTDTATNTGNGAFPKKKEKSSLICRIRGVRSKSLKEGLSIQERMKLFESC